jgi:hypothetical protein
MSPAPTYTCTFQEASLLQDFEKKASPHTRARLLQVPEFTEERAASPEQTKNKQTNKQTNSKM